MYWALFGRAGSTNSWISFLDKDTEITNSGWCNQIGDITEIVSKLHNYIRVGVFLCACEYITFYISDSMCTSCVDERVQKV